MALRFIQFEVIGDFVLSVNIMNSSSVSSGVEYQEVEVHLLREKTGFGFRILGGDEAVQAVSPEARDKARMGQPRRSQHSVSLIPAQETRESENQIDVANMSCNQPAELYPNNRRLWEAEALSFAVSWQDRA